MQAQIQALLTAQGGARTGGEATGSNMGSHMEVAKPAIFNGEAGKVGGFIMACRLFLRMKLRGAMVEEQVQWVLSYVQGGSADVVKIVNNGLNLYFCFLFYFLFSFSFILFFLFLEQLGLGVISHAVTSVTT